jgi:signal transduction histidine kinase
MRFARRTPSIADRLTRGLAVSSGAVVAVTVVLVAVLVAFALFGLVPDQQEAHREERWVRDFEARVSDQKVAQGRYRITLERRWLVARDRHRASASRTLATALADEQEADEYAELSRLRSDYARLNALQDRGAALAPHDKEAANRLSTRQDIPLYVSIQRRAERLAALVKRRAEDQLDDARRLFVGFAILIAVAGVGSLWAVTRHARRDASELVVGLRRLRDAIAGTADLTAGRRVAPEGPDELGELGRHFNDLVQRVAALDRARLEFVAAVSHELRTPLAAIGGYTELLESELEAPTRQQLEDLEVVARNARRLERRVEDLMLFARMQAGELSVVLERLDLADVARSTLDEQRAAAEERSIALTPGSIEDGVWVRGDRERLRQVASNLVANAIKFTPPGGRVVVGVQGNGSTAILDVADTGAGMPDEDVTRAFDVFYRGGNATSGVAGTGLGLAIVREIVERHGGSVRLDSAPGRGTRAVVELIREPVARAPRPG